MSRFKRSLFSLCVVYTLLWPIIAQLSASPPPLRVSNRANNSVQLSWTNVASTLALEISDSLKGSTGWRLFPQSPTLVNGEFSISVGFTNASQFFRLHEVSATNLPPDPATVATLVPEGVATPFAEATSFLYSGPNSIQTGVSNGVITAQQGAVLRGEVRARDGSVPFKSTVER